MPDINDLFAQIPFGQLAEKFGVDEDSARASVAAALPALMQGLQANAADPDGAASIERALSGKDSQLVDGGINLDDVDEQDGSKIVAHIFGDAKPEVESRLDALKVPDGLMSKVLPVLAPLVLAFLAKQMFGKKDEPAAKEPEASGGGGIGDILGSVLGGGSGGGGIGDILGNVLGGGSSSSSSGGGGIGDILGGLFGGGDDDSKQGNSGGGGIGDILGGLLGGGSR